MGFHGAVSSCPWCDGPLTHESHFSLGSTSSAASCTLITSKDNMCFQLSAITQTPSSTPTKYSDTRMQKNKYITDCVCCFLEQMCYEAYRCRVCSGCYLESMACGLAFKINRFVVWFGLCGGPLGLNSLLWSKDGILCIVIAIFETLTFFFCSTCTLSLCGVPFPSLPFPSLPFPSPPYFIFPSHFFFPFHMSSFLFTFCSFL